MKAEDPLTNAQNTDRLTNNNTVSKFRQKGPFINPAPRPIQYNIKYTRNYKEAKIHILNIHHRSSYFLLPSNFFIAAAPDTITLPTHNAASNIHDFIRIELSGNLAHGIPTGIVIASLKQRN